MIETQAPRDRRDIPQGWSFNPSTRAHRYRLLPFAASGFLIAVYLALCQLRVISRAWDPFFADGTQNVLHSSVSKALPIPDALLGVMAYFAEILFLLIGPENRWRSRPWLTRISGLVMLALGATSLGLLILQPTVVHDWCTWCLLSALMAFILVQRSIAELLASVQSFFFHHENSSLSPAAQKKFKLSPWTEGTHCVWTLFLSAVLGGFLLAAPPLLGIEGTAKVSIEFSGAVIVAASLVSMSEPARVLRFLNGLIGMLLIAWFLGQPSGLARWLIGALGLAVSLLSLYSPKLKFSYGVFAFGPTLED